MFFFVSVKSVKARIFVSFLYFIDLLTDLRDFYKYGIHHSQVNKLSVRHYKQRGNARIHMCKHLFFPLLTHRSCNRFQKLLNYYISFLLPLFCLLCFYSNVIIKRIISFIVTSCVDIANLVGFILLSE